MNVGLILTSASVYQMLRGAVVIFTGLFSYLFLNRRLRMYEWLSLVMVVVGVGIVGLSSVLMPQKKPDAATIEDSFDYSSLLGVGLVLGAQLFTASQFVIEEKILVRYKVTPLKAVGLEGSFGLISVLAAMPLLHILLAKQHPAFDAMQGYHDFFDHPRVWQTGLAISISIAFFNWFGLSITSTVSATARSTIDACR
jgi:drug/metabolite transporter (DMT)-like permease